jgi:hypothetical protein
MRRNGREATRWRTRCLGQVLEILISYFGLDVTMRFESIQAREVGDVGLVPFNGPYIRRAGWTSEVDRRKFQVSSR